MTTRGLTWQERYWLKVDTTPRGKTGCHRWTGAVNSEGYGSFCIDTQRKRAVGAHRIAFFLANGRWPEHQALHTCDNHWCVNPDHIYDGTQQQNVADMIERSATTPIGRRGAANPSARFTRREVVRLRQRHAQGESAMLLAQETAFDLKAMQALLAGQSYSDANR